MPDTGTIVPAAVTRREANVRVRELIEQLAGDASSREWAFFCECGDPSCTETVRLDPEVFDALVARPEGRVLSERHHGERGERRRAEAARRQSVTFVAHLMSNELLDAADDLVRIVDHGDELDLCPATLDLLFAFDEAISAADEGR